ncbi:MAG: DUF192 domain-containing protein [Elusimicrobiota bacterium]
MAKGYFVAFNSTRGRALARKVRLADTPYARAKGLLGRERMDPDEGLWIDPCAMIHTFFMRFPIDALFLDKRLRVVHIAERLKPWRLSRWVFSARSVLELAGGALDGSVAVGDQLEFNDDGFAGNES